MRRTSRKSDHIRLPNFSLKILHGACQQFVKTFLLVHVGFPKTSAGLVLSVRFQGKNKNILKSVSAMAKLKYNGSATSTL